MSWNTSNVVMHQEVHCDFVTICPCYRVCWSSTSSTEPATDTSRAQQHVLRPPPSPRCSVFMANYVTFLHRPSVIQKTRRLTLAPPMPSVRTQQRSFVRAPVFLRCRSTAELNAPHPCSWHTESGSRGREEGAIVTGPNSDK